jgi:hypothetical protein
MDELTKSQQHEERMKILYENHGWKLNTPPNLLPPEDKSNFGGGLKCFKMVYDRDETGGKLETMHRCGNPAAKGSFFCAKKHGGGNQNNLVHGKRSVIASTYQGAFGGKVGTLFDAYLNDPSITDAKVILASLLTCYRQYIEKVNNPEKSIKRPIALLKQIKFIQKSIVKTPLEKFLMIKELCASQTTLADGEVVDRMMSICETISRIIERIDKQQGKDEFILTPDGLKIFIRCMIDIIKEHVSSDDIEKVKERILTINTRTEGDISKYEVTKLKNVTTEATNG